MLRIYLTNLRLRLNLILNPKNSNTRIKMKNTNRRLSSRFLAVFARFAPTRIRTWAGVSPTGRVYPYWEYPTHCMLSDTSMAEVSYMHQTVTMHINGVRSTISYRKMTAVEFIDNVQQFLNCKF